MIHGNVCNEPVSPNQICTLAMYMEELDLLAALEHIKPPPQNRFPCFRRLVVFQNGAVSINRPDSVGLRCQQPRRCEVGFRLASRGQGA